MRVGGQNLWNALPICETSKIFYPMGRRPMKDVLGNHLMDRLFHLRSLVEYYPISAKDQSRIHQYGKKVLPGLFLGYALYAGGIWKLQTLRSWRRWTHRKSTQKRLNAKEVIFPKQGEFIFPIEDGRIKHLGGDQDLRTSTFFTAATNSRRKSP